MIRQQVILAGNRESARVHGSYDADGSRRSIFIKFGALSVCSTASCLLGCGQAAGLGSLLDGDQVAGIQQAYDNYAGDYDTLDGGYAADALGFRQQRRDLLALANGDVLEVGVGTGLNLPFYRPAQLTSLTAIDLSEGMLREARAKVTNLGLPLQRTTFRQADVVHLPFNDESFDAVIDTFSLCVFPRPLDSLRSMARVVRPGGQILLLEHSRSPHGLLGLYQDVTAVPVAAISKGCFWNQDVPQLVSEAGLKIVRIDSHLGGLIVSIVASKI